MQGPYGRTRIDISSDTRVDSQHDCFTQGWSCIHQNFKLQIGCPMRTGHNVNRAPQDVAEVDPLNPTVIDPSGKEDTDLLTDTLLDAKTTTPAECRWTGATLPEGINDNNSDTQSLRSVPDTDISEGEDEDKAQGKISKYLDPLPAATRLDRIDEILALLSDDSAKLVDTVKHLEDSLEFSHKEIADLKKET